jgi:hypothetical protein
VTDNGCLGRPPTPVRGAEPAEILGKIALMRRPPRPTDNPPEGLPLGGPQVVRVYTDAVRYAGRHDGAEIYVVAAEVISRSAVDDEPRCVPPDPPGEPGLCVVSSTPDGGWLQA